MKKSLLVSIVAVVCIILATVVYLRMTAPAGMAAVVAPADNREFFPVMHGLLSSADESIDVVLYQGRFYFHYPASTSNALLSDLIDAAQRGVKVRAVMERADWNLENSEENRDVARVLADGGVQVYFDPPGTTSHTKLVIIDDRYAVVGSNNWNYYAIEVNNEANVVVDSKEVADAFTGYFNEIVGGSDTGYTSPIEAVPAAKFAESSGRYVLLKDVADSAAYDADSQTGYVYLDDVKVTVRESPLEELLVVSPLFFSQVEGESVRVLGRMGRQRGAELEALDIESAETDGAVEIALERERENLARADLEKTPPDWIRGARVTPLPNRTYAPAMEKLLASARKRIWIAMLDARYYETTPATASKTKGPDEIPSLTNMILGKLVQAAVDGVDVRLVCDMGWRGSLPPDKTAFLEKLKAGGGHVYADSPEVTTHAKLVIVDDDFSVVGSTNWSYHAVEENNETSVIVESEPLNDHYAGYIQGLIDEGEPY